MMQTSLHPMVPPNAGQILTNIIRNFAPTHRTLLFEEIFQKKETDLLLQLALSPQSSLTNFTVSISLLIDVVWNTRFLPDDPSNQTEGDFVVTPGVMYGLDEGQTLPPPPPEFVKKNLLANLGKFVECLMYDWSKTDSVGDVTLSQHTDAHHHHSPGPPPTSPRAKGKKKATNTTSTSVKPSPILSPRAKGGASSAAPASPSSSSSSLGAPSSPSSSLPHPFPSPSPAQTPTTAISIPCPQCLRNGHSVGNYRLKLIILLSTLIRSGYNDEIDTAFIANKVFAPLISLFFAHPANNIVHSELYTLFEQTMLFRTSKLKVDLCVTSKLVDNVAEELEKEKIRADSKQKEQDEGTGQTARANRIPSSQAFLAHLLHLARILQEHRETLPELDEAIRRFDRWTVNYEAVVDPQMKEQAEDGLMRLPTEEDGGDAYGGQMGENPFTGNTDGWNFGSTGDGEDDYHG